MTSDERPPLLSVRDLRVAFPTPSGPLQAIDGVSFDIAPREVLGVVGESGSGKSVTALSLMRLLPDSARVDGAIAFNGVDVLGMPGGELQRLRGKHVSMIFQDPMTSLNPVRTVGAQLEETMRTHLGVSRRAARERAAELLGEVGIPDPRRHLDVYPHELSGGMCQRVMIAMALSCEPQLVLADEPTTALDVSVQAQILELLRTVIARHGTALMMITHDLSVVAGLADRVAVMYAGEIVELAPSEQLFAHPRHPYTASLLDCITRLDDVRADTLPAIPGAPPDLTRAALGLPVRAALRAGPARMRGAAAAGRKGAGARGGLLLRHPRPGAARRRHRDARARGGSRRERRRRARRARSGGPLQARRTASPHPPAGARGRRRQLRGAPRRDAGPGRRVGLGQVDGGAGDPPARSADRRRGAPRR